MVSRLTVTAALTIQVVLFSIFFYIDSRQIIAPDWQGVRKFGLNPLVIAFFGLTPLALWWSYRTIYQAVSQRFWTASIIQGLLIRVAHLGACYLATRVLPTRGQALGLALAAIAAIFFST